MEIPLDKLTEINKEAEKYIREVYIDYGDLTEKAEEQIRDAFIDGAKQFLERQLK